MLRRTSRLASAVFSVICTAIAAGAPGLPPPDRTELPGDTVTVRVESLTPLPPLVEVVANDGKPLRLFLDTGLDACFAIHAPTAERLGLRPLGTNTIRAFTGSDQVTMTRIETLRIGAATFRGCSGLIANIDPVADLDADGFIGLRLFADCLMTVDDRAATLMLARGALAPSDGEEILEYTVNQDNAMVSVRIGDDEYGALIDTGASDIVLADAMSRHVATDRPPAVIARFVDAAGVGDVRAARLTGRMTLGRHEVERPVVHFGGRWNVLGWSVLSHFEMTIDQSNRRIRFRRAGNDPIRFPPVYRCGFDVEPGSDGARVGHVIPDSAADRAGIRVDDVLVAVDDRPIDEVSWVRWYRRSNQPGTRTLLVRRGAETLEFVVEAALVVE